jgi:hypothetical protein
MDDIDARGNENIARSLAYDYVMHESTHINYLPFSTKRYYNTAAAILGCDYLPLNMIAITIYKGSTKLIQIYNAPPLIATAYCYDGAVLKSWHIFCKYKTPTTHIGNNHSYYEICIKDMICLRATIDARIIIIAW